MTNLTSIHIYFRVLGFIGLAFIFLNKSEAIFMPVNYGLYIMIFSLVLISLGIFFKLKFAKEEPSVITYIVTFIPLLLAITLSASLLFSLFL